jgi:hypothetical protein
MTTNSHFARQNSERNVVEDLTIESIKIHGVDMVYIPRVLVNEDTLFGEDTLSKFTEGNIIEMYVDSADGFEGEGDFMSKFGLQIKDSVSLIVSKKRFETVLGHTTTKPREGDLIYFPLSKGLFEIKFVEHENPFYQLGKLYTYKLSCELFTYSQEEIDTGFSDVDSLEDNRKEFSLKLTLGTRVSGTSYTNFYEGETVYQVSGYSGDRAILGNTGADATAKVIDWDSTNSLLHISGISGSVNTGGVHDTIRGQGSSAEYLLSTSTTTTVIIPTEGTADVAGDNEAIEFEIDSDGVFDFTDIDPFSEGKYS